MKKLTIILMLLGSISFLRAAAQTPGSVKRHNKISAADTSLGHSLTWHLGQSVCMMRDMDGDGNNEIAASSSFGYGGFIYLFRLNSNGKVKPSYTAIGQDSSGMTGYIPSNFQAFGSALANVGDLNGNGVDDIVAGNYFGGVSSLQGELYVLFINAGGTVDSFKQIRPYLNGFNDTLAAGGAFGNAVANIGDLDNDGVNDIAVGNVAAYSGEGAVWIIFMNHNGTVKNARQISSISGDFTILPSLENFGTSITALGDLDKDGHPDIMVGGLGGIAQKGDAWTLFLKADGTVKSFYHYEPGTTTFPDTANNNAAFGYAVASIGDIDGDSVTDAAISAIAYIDSTGESYGRVWVAFLNTNGSVKGTQVIDKYHGNLGINLHSNDDFGSCLAPAGDFNKDHIYDLWVGAQRDDDAEMANPTTNSGALYLLSLNGIPITTGIGDIIEARPAGLTVYPNPCGDQLIVGITEPGKQIDAITVCDITGNCCFIKSSINQASFALDVAHLAPGNYIIKIKTQGTTGSVTFIKH